MEIFFSITMKIFFTKVNFNKELPELSKTVLALFFYPYFFLQIKIKVQNDQKGGLLRFEMISK
jgi:hypothetical protein